MRRSLLLVALALLLPGDATAGRPFRARIAGGRNEVILETPPSGPITPPTAPPHPGDHGSTIVADVHGLLIAERNAGAVIRCGRDGAPRGRLDLHPGLGEMVAAAAGPVYVADRAADRLVRLDPGDADGKGLAITAEVAVREPHGLALSPDGATLLVTSVADHQLVAIDTAALKIRWRAELAPEPRGVTVTADGAHAVVGFLTTGSLAQVDLAAGTRVRWLPLNPRDQIDVSADATEPDPKFSSRSTDPEFIADDPPELVARLREARSRFQVPTSTGRRYARGAFALGLVGGGRVVAAHEVATPQLVQKPDNQGRDRYSGATGFAPIVHRLGLFDRPGDPGGFAEIDLHQPRAFAYDHARDTLYVGGYGDDNVIAVAGISQQSQQASWVSESDGAEPCGIDGLVVDRGRLWVHCELSRRLGSIDLAAVTTRATTTWVAGPVLAPSTRPALVERGAELFRRAGDHTLSADGVLACASCHPEGRTDGLNWRLGPSVLQTPVLAGRLAATAPFKWDGQDRDLRASLQHTVERLGGQPEHLTASDFNALQAFLESLQPPRPRAVADADAVARGRALFTDLTCDACHAGPTLSDGALHPFKGSLTAVNTPSLLGLGHSAPYYHDGSAGDLWALVTDKGSVHDMVDPGALARLTRPQAADLIAYLASL